MTGTRATRHRERYAPLLSALRDGDLGRVRTALLHRHLRACLSCQQVLKEIDEQVAALQALASPPEEGSQPGAPASYEEDAAWLALQATLRAGPPGKGPPLMSLISGPGLRRAAPLVAVGCLSAALLVLLPRYGYFGPAPSDDVMLSLAEEEFRQAEQHYQRALDHLLLVSARARARWTAAQVRAYEQDLGALQRSTEHYRSLARSRPADADAQELLYASYRRQIDYLQDTLVRAQGAAP